MIFDIFKLSGVAKDFLDFIYEQRIIGFFIGTFAGIASSNFITSFKKNILDFILTKVFKLNTLSSLFFITSIIEFFLMLLALYFIIKLINPYFKQRDNTVKNEENKYHTELISTLNKINSKLTSATSIA